MTDVTRDGQRAASARRLLAEAGIDATVRAAGQGGEVAAVRAPIDRFADVAAQAPALKALGYRWVALEIGPDPAREEAST